MLAVGQGITDEREDDHRLNRVIHVAAERLERAEAEGGAYGSEQWKATWRCRCGEKAAHRADLIQHEPALRDALLLLHCPFAARRSATWNASRASRNQSDFTGNWRVLFFQN